MIFQLFLGYKFSEIYNNDFYLFLFQKRAISIIILWIDLDKTIFQDFKPIFK